MMSERNWEELGLPNKITLLPAHLSEVCDKVLSSRNDIINCLRLMGTTNEMGEANYASKIRQWAIDGDTLDQLVGKATQQTEKDAQSVSSHVAELLCQATTLTTEITQMKEQLMDQKPGNTKRMIPTPRATKEDANNLRHIELERISRGRIRALEREVKDLTASLSQAKQRQADWDAQQRAMADNVTSVKQKTKHVTEEKEKLQSSYQSAHRDMEIMCCDLKERNAKLEISLKEQKETADSTAKEMAAIENCLRILDSKFQFFFRILKLKGSVLPTN